MISAIRRRLAAKIGEAFFRRAIRGSIPDYVRDILALNFPIPLIRAKTWPLVTFSYNGPFERDLMLTGWEEFTAKGPLALVYAMIGDAGLNPSRAYTRWATGEQTQVWIILDASGQKACFYMTGVDLIR